MSFFKGGFAHAEACAIVERMDTTQTLSSAPVQESQNDVATLQTLIERQIERLDAVRQQIRTHTDSMKSIFENDTELAENETQVQEVSKKSKARKKTLTEAPEFRELRAKSAELKDEVKELQESLNSYLLTYYQQTGVKTVDLGAGGQREFKVIAKLLPKKGDKEE